MSTDLNSPGPAGPIGDSTRSRGVALWLGLALLAAGIVVALLGVRAALASYERGQDIERYAHASTGAHYAASTGADAVTLGKKLLALNRSEATAAPELRRLILARNSSAYNSRHESIDQNLTRKQDLLDRIETLDRRLSRALAADGEGGSTGASPSPGP